MHSRFRGCRSFVECCTRAVDSWGGASWKNKGKEAPIREWPQFISTLQGRSGLFVYVHTVAKRMMTDCSPAQHDFSQEPVFVKNKDGHLVRRIRTSKLLTC